MTDEEPKLDPELEALAWQFSRKTAEHILRCMRVIEEHESGPEQRWELLRASLERFAAGA